MEDYIVSDAPKVKRVLSEKQRDALQKARLKAIEKQKERRELERKEKARENKTCVPPPIPETLEPDSASESETEPWKPHRQDPAAPPPIPKRNMKVRTNNDPHKSLNPPKIVDSVLLTAIQNGYEFQFSKRGIMRDNNSPPKIKRQMAERDTQKHDEGLSPSIPIISQKPTSKAQFDPSKYFTFI